MRHPAVLAIGALITASVSAPHAVTPPVLPGPIGSLHRPIRTTVRETQRLFDQGLTLFYGFNREGARRSFAAAAALDPAAAMPHVGVALSFGPNLNTDSTVADTTRGCTSARRGARLSRQPDERAYADALVLRYCRGLSFDSSTEYAIELGTLFARRPDDPDAATLYADSLLMLRPRAGQQNAELVAVLELVLKRWPNHAGANHYYVHAVEGSASPERGLASARRLETLVPAVGHLLHMPSHIYTRLGDYDKAIESNVRAAAADLAYLESNAGDREQAMYHEHDVESLAVALGSAGRFQRAEQVAATRIGGHGHGADVTTTASGFSPLKLFVLLRFFRWHDVVQSPPPPQGDRTRVFHHFAQAVAHAQLKQWPLAEAERQAFEREVDAVPADAVYRSNQLQAVLHVLHVILEARVGSGRGNSAATIDAWRRAVAAQDQLTYHEPAPVYYPVRESLGAALFKAQRFGDAARVFQDDLARNPRSGRSLFGLWQTLGALGRPGDAEAAHRRFLEAWATSDVALSLDDDEW